MRGHRWHPVFGVGLLVAGELGEPVQDRLGQVLRHDRLQQRQPVTHRPHRHGPFLGCRLVTFDDTGTGEGGRDLPHVRTGAGRGLGLGELDRRGLVQAERARLDGAVVDRLGDRERGPDDLPHVSGRHPAGFERVPQCGEVRIQRPGVGEGMLDRAFRDAPGRGVLRDHRTPDRVPMHRRGSGILLHQHHPPGQQRRRLRLPGGDLTTRLHPLIQQGFATPNHT